MTQSGVDPGDFRRVLGSFATGVVVVAARTAGGERIGMSANSFTSVSLEPPLVLFCAAHTSSTWPRLQEANGFAISVLAGHQEHVGRGFSRRGVDRFAGHAWQESPSGHPVVADSLAWLDCTLEAVHVAGDHDIAVARVTGLASPASTGADGPLVFFRGSYFGLGGPAAAPGAGTPLPPPVRATA